MLYIYRAVIRRLRILSESMHKRVIGENTPLPTSGSDEISDMAQATEFFVSTIERRERLLREVMELSPVGALLVSRQQGIVRYATRRCIEMIGSGPEAFIGSDAAALFATLRRIVQFAIPIAAATFVFGFIDGNNDLRSYRNPYIFHMKDDNQDELRIVLRNFDKGVLVRDPVKGRVEFIRWENVISIGRIAVATQNVPLSCYWLGLGCGEVVTP